MSKSWFSKTIKMSKSCKSTIELKYYVWLSNSTLKSGPKSNVFKLIRDYMLFCSLANYFHAFEWRKDISALSQKVLKSLKINIEKY